MKSRGRELPDPVLRERYLRAVGFALQLHGEQPRKGSEIPYLSHLLAVSSLVMEDGGTEDEVIAALLHDGPEDAGGEPVLTEIRSQFGDEVADLVRGLSDAMPAPGEEKAPWLPRKRAYLARLRTESPPVLRISLADKLHNLRAIATDLADPSVGSTVWKRFSADADQAWYFRNLLATYERLLPESRNLPAFRRLVRATFPAHGRARQSLRLLSPGLDGTWIRSRAPLDRYTVARLVLAARPIRASRDISESHHVYVALLNGVDGDAPYSFYVGMTGSTVEERYVQHKAGTYSGKGWVEDRGIGLLPQLVNRFNPMSGRSAELVEKQLLWRLTAAGFDVHGA